MTDNRTTELTATDRLRAMLDERGVEYEAYRDIKNRRITKWRTYHGAFVFFAVEKEGKLFVETTSDTEHSAICTPEQAIAATLGSEQHPYELRITGDGSDWGEIMRDAYDDLMASASESCTPGEIADLEAHIAAELGNSTLTAEQVREAIKKYAEDDSCYIFEVYGEMCGPIADELNAELGSGTCELVETDSYSNSRETIHVLECSECGKTCEHVNGSYPRCPNCGKAVKR